MPGRFTQADQVLCKLGDPCTCKTVVYHKQCIGGVMANNPTCPCCRKDIKNAKIRNIFDNQEIKSTTQQTKNDVLDDIQTKINALSFNQTNQLKIEYLNYLKDTPTFSLDQKKKIFEHLDNKIDVYDNSELFRNLVPQIAAAGYAHTPHAAFWQWVKQCMEGA